MSTIRVVVCEDLAVWATSTPPRYEDDEGVITFDVYRTISELIAAIEDGYDVVLIDDVVPFVSGQEATPNAVRAVAEITNRYGVGKPWRILWTQVPPTSHLTTYAFCSYGGHYFVNKRDAKLGGEDLVEAIRAVTLGARWQEPRRPLKMRADERRLQRWRRLLALLANGRRAEDIAKELETTPKMVSQTISEIAKSLGVQRGDGTFSQLVPTAAARLGYCWVPAEWWHLQPESIELWLDELPRSHRERDDLDPE